MEPRRDIFVDRQEQLEFCLEAAKAGQGSAILLIQGLDGIGKTALLDELESACRAVGILCAHVDFATRREYASYYNFLTASTDLWCQLNLGTIEELSQLITAVYETNSGHSRTDPVPDVESIMSSATHVEVASAGRTHTISGTIEHLAPGAQAAIGAYITQVHGQFNQTIYQKDASVLEPLIRANVTAGFRNRLRQVTARRKVLILLDSWETVLTTQDHLLDPGAWVCASLLDLLSKEEITNCVAVIASAGEPGIGKLMRHVRRVPIGPLPEDAVRDYMCKTITSSLDGESITQLTEISHGIPLAMTLLADGVNKHQKVSTPFQKPNAGADATGAVIGVAVDRYLESLSENVVQAIRIGAVPHRLNTALLLKLGVGEADIHEVLQCSFVVWDADRDHFTYHPAVRRHLLAWWDAHDLNQYRQLSRAALDYFAALAADSADAGQPLYTFEREVFYHWLVDDEAAAFGYLSERFENPIDQYAFDHAQGFVDYGVEIEHRGMLSSVGMSWLEYLQARLNVIRGQGDMGEVVLARLVDTVPDHFLQTLARWNLGIIRVQRHQWSEGVRLYRESLKDFRSLNKPGYVIRVMLALGDAYCGLAQASGGIHQRRSERTILYVVQHLPFLAYEQLVRWSRFLPNWYFGTNYQNWIVAHLLVEGGKWYRKAEKELEKRDDTHYLFQTQLSLAEIDHRLNRWKRAWRRYHALANLTGSAPARSNYRQAQVEFGQGRTLFDESKLVEAEAHLQNALDGFENFIDNRSAGAAAEVLGQLYAEQKQSEKALNAYRRGLDAYRALNDQLAATRVACLLEDLADMPATTEDVMTEAQELAAQIETRQYLVRFPDRLLRWFRRLALAGALPLSYMLALILSLLLVLTIMISEGEVLLAITGGNAGTALSDIIFLVGVAILPTLFILWFYRLVYTFLGMVVVYVLGRRLDPIEKEQPRLITCGVQGVVTEDLRTNKQIMIKWADVNSQFSVYYCLHGHPLELISSYVLIAESNPALAFESVTSGYNHLVRDIKKRLAIVRPQVHPMSKDFVVFCKRWVLAVSLAVGLVAVYFLAGGYIDITYEVITSTNPEVVIGSGASQPPESSRLVHAWLTSIYFSFVPTWLLVGAAVTLWRLTIHQMRIGRQFRREHPSLPIWLIGLAAIVLTLLSMLWVWMIYTAR